MINSYELIQSHYLDICMEPELVELLDFVYQGKSDAYNDLMYVIYNSERLSKVIYQEIVNRNETLALVVLGNYHFHGLNGLEKNAVKAFELFSQASLTNDAIAQNLMCMCYLMGEGVQQDIPKAIQYCTLSAEQGCRESQGYLGTIYHEGKYVPKNQKLAFDWWLKAAEQGFAQSQYNVALYYLHGNHVSHNLSETVKWLHKSALQDHEKARNTLNTLVRSLVKFTAIEKST